MEHKLGTNLSTMQALKPKGTKAFFLFTSFFSYPNAYTMCTLVQIFSCIILI